MDNSSSTASEFASSHFAAEVVDVQPLRVQSSLMLCALLRNLGFHGVIERWCGDDGEIPCSKVLEAYVHCRFNSSDPVPVSRFEEWLAKSCIPSLLGVPAAKLNESRLGRVLELVGKAPQAMWIELLSNAHRVFHLDLAYVINDTSAFYFEGEYETSDYARYGHSKDGKPECKQINVSLSVSGDHSIPLLYTPLAGNTSDTTTVIPNLQRLRGLFNELGCADARPVVIADKGLLTMRLIHYYRKVGFGYIGTLRSPKLESEILCGVSDDELFSSPLPYCAERYKDNPKKRELERYFGVRRTVTLPAFKEDNVAYPELEQEALVVYSEGKRRLDAGKREDLLAKTEARLAEIAGHLNSGKYRKLDYAEQQINKALSRHATMGKMLTCALSSNGQGLLSLYWSRNDTVIQEATFLDGKYVVYTSERDLTDDDLFERFKSRDRVEKRISTLKGPVVVRPIFLHKDERILGLLFGTMTALLLYGIAELLARRDGCRITGEEIQKQFQDYGGSVLTFQDGSQVVALPQGTKLQRRLHGAMNVGAVSQRIAVRSAQPP